MCKLKTSCWVVVCLATLLMTTARFSVAQASSQGDINSEIESLRADYRADKVKIITAVMQFTEKDSAAFWPIYKKYEAELTKLNDERVDLIKAYANKYDTMTDADAKSMSEKAFDLESRRVELRKKYFKEFSSKIPATVVARYFQLEHRLDLLVDLELASELPPLQKKSITQ